MVAVMELYDRSVRVEVSKAAAHICAERSSPLLVEMELQLGCLVTKRTHFRDVTSNTSGVQINPCLFLDFRATVSNACDPGSEGGGTHNDNAVANIHPYVPSWCHIDYADGQWSCEFGYDRNQH